uniref:Uncharacterized protein n=1 Tax=Cacopsylla melanoneura TaxID=428564 RepID=A0A8D9BH88_9HEMI
MEKSPLGSSSPTKGEYGPRFPSGKNRHRRRLTMGNITRDVRQNIPFVTRVVEKIPLVAAFFSLWDIGRQAKYPFVTSSGGKNPAASGFRFSTCGILSGKEEGVHFSKSHVRYNRYNDSLRVGTIL